MVQRFPVIVGPTAGGKSALALALARRLRHRLDLPAEILTADSMQVYRGMDIGTAKPAGTDRDAVPHHLLDLVEPGRDRFTVDDWLRRADTLIASLRAGGTVPIVVGGTHLYVKALLEGLFQGPAPSPEERQRLRAAPSDARRAELERVDPAAAERIHPNDERRTLRALEVYHATGVPMSSHQQQWNAGSARPDALLVGLLWPPETLARRINARVRAMVDAGLVDEARGLWLDGRLRDQPAEALGYKQLIAHFEGRCTLEHAVERIKVETRRFAKNQRTWLRQLRRTPGSLWLEAQERPAEDLAETIVDALLAPAPDPNGPERCIDTDDSSPPDGVGGAPQGHRGPGTESGRPKTG